MTAPRKTYAPRSRALAADIALQAAVDEAVGLLRNVAALQRLTTRAVTAPVRVEALALAERRLLAAATTAELILGSES